MSDFRGQNSRPSKTLTQLHDHPLVPYNDPEAVWWCDNGAGGNPSPGCEVGGQKPMSGRFHCSEGCNYDLCPPCVWANKAPKYDNDLSPSHPQQRRPSTSKYSNKNGTHETDPLLGTKGHKQSTAHDWYSFCRVSLKWIVLVLLLCVGIVFVAIWLKRAFFTMTPLAFVYPSSYRVSSNFTLLLAKLQASGSPSYVDINDWADEVLSIDFDQSTSLLNATGTDLNYYDYTKEPPLWSSRTMYDPLTSSKINGLTFLHDGTGTTNTGDYYYYSVINGTYTCSKFKYQVPPRDLFVLEGKLIGTKSLNGEQCYVWRAPYNNGIIEQWVSSTTHLPKRQLASLHYPVGGGVEAQALLITDFLNFQAMRIPDYVFPPPNNCLSA